MVTFSKQYFKYRQRKILNVLFMFCLKVSALVTGEFYTRKEHFPGFARPFVFNAEVLLKLVGNFSKPFFLTYQLSDES